MTKKTRVLIIGAGLAGLAAANTLPSSQFETIILEAKKEGYLDIAIPPEEFNVESIMALISSEFGRKPGEIQSVVIESSKTEVCQRKEKEERKSGDINVCNKDKKGV